MASASTAACANTAAPAAPAPAHDGNPPPLAPTAAVDAAAHGAVPMQGPIMLHMPVDVRNLSLALLALFASVALLHWASAVFIPVMLSLLLTTALRPAVDTLRRWHIPRWLGAAVLLIAIVSALAKRS